MFILPMLLGTYSPDLTLITDATDAIVAIVAAAILVFVAAFGWPVANKVYHVAKRVLGSS
jgi:hypothetical protein